MRVFLTLILLVASAPLGAQELTPESCAKWREYLLPKPGESEWRKIPWRTTFWDAMQEGRREEKPVLLWAMNGHPLACT